VFETVNRESVRRTQRRWMVSGASPARTGCRSSSTGIAMPNLYYRDETGERRIDGDRLEA